MLLLCFIQWQPSSVCLELIFVPCDEKFWMCLAPDKHRLQCESDMDITFSLFKKKSVEGV